MPLNFTAVTIAMRGLAEENQQPEISRLNPSNNDRARLRKTNPRPDQEGMLAHECNPRPWEVG